MIWGDLLLGARKQRAALALVTLVIGLGAIGLVLRSTDRADRTVNDHATELYELLRDDGEPTWQWADFDASSDLMTIDDESLHSRGLVVPIGVAHSQGLLHRGTWTAVITDEAPRRRLLLLRRASHLATCPSAWGLVGEHSEVGEQWLDTSRRVLEEELGLDLASGTIEPSLLVPGSVLVRAQYPELARRDLQATALTVAILPSERVEDIAPDSEVAEMRWVDGAALRAMLEADDAGGEFCNTQLLALAQLVLEKLVEKDLLDRS